MIIPARYHRQSGKPAAACAAHKISVTLSSRYGASLRILHCRLHQFERRGLVGDALVAAAILLKPFRAGYISTKAAPRARTVRIQYP